MTAITCPENGTICQTMDDAGAGLGVFIGYLASSLPLLLIILAIVGVVVAVGVGLGKVISNAVSRHK